MKKIYSFLALFIFIVNGKAQCPITINGNTTICSGDYTTLTASSAATSYTWSTGALTASVSVSPNTTITYTVIGTNGACTDSTTVTVIVNPAINISGVYTTPNCGQCNGSATLTPVGGTAPYTYQWFGGNGTVFTTQTIQGLCAGTYSGTVTDAMGCYNFSMFNLTQSGNTANLVTTVTPASCGQSDGSIKIDSIIGGTPPFIYYLFYNGSTINTSTITPNLPAGNYGVGISDSLGCLTSTSVTVNNSNITAQLIPTAPGCNLCNGSVSANIIGGIAPYTYTWTNGSTTSSLNNLCTGHYQLSVTDSVGCFTSTGINLITPNAPVIIVDSIKKISCSGITTGAATIHVTGGVAPYTYAWNTSPPQNTNIATGLQNGNYMVTVTDNTGCYTTQSIYIANASNIYVPVLSISPVNCGNNGSATINAYGGTPPYTYHWSNGATGQTATNLAAGNYTVTAIDAYGCNGVGYVNITSQCMNIIKGRVYNDANQNCVQDAGEAGMPNVSVYASGYYGYTNGNGDYMIQTPSLMNNVSATNMGQPYYTILCPNNGIVSANFTHMGDTISNTDFAYYVNPNYIDVGIHPGWSASSPGSTKTYWFLYWNYGPTPQNAVVTLLYDSLLQYTGCTQGGVQYPAQHKIEWSFPNLVPGVYWDWNNRPQAFFNVPNTITLNDTLFTHFEITPLTGDINPGDNILDAAEPVTGSHDPNEKTVYPSGNISRSDSVLFYTIHFQNNGNDTAFKVVVIDTLSPFLDPATVIPGAADHAYEFTISGQGILTWTFNKIMLPDSGTNQTASNGYLNFTVKQKPNNPFGSIIKNTADIYFDYNTAVVTNTTVNNLAAPLSINTFDSKNNQLLLYPNPTNDCVTLQYNFKNNSSGLVEIRNILGQLIKTITLTNKQTGLHTENINTADFMDGVYVIKLTADGMQQTKKLIIQR